MARVFDERQTMTRAQLRELGQPAGIAAVVHDHDGLRPRRHEPLDCLRIDRRLVEADDVRKHRSGADRDRGVRRRDEIDGRLDDLVSGPDTEGQVGEMERGRPARHGERMFDTEKV